MDLRLSQLRYESCVKQRSLLIKVVCGTLCINIIQGIERLSMDERVILVPPEIHQDMVVSKHYVSEQYLEEWGYFFSQALLSVSEYNFGYQRDLVLRHVDPGRVGVIKAKMQEDYQRLKDQQCTTRFMPQQAWVDPENLSVTVKGMLATYVGREKVSENQKEFVMMFRYERGRFLRLMSFDETTKKPTYQDIPVENTDAALPVSPLQSTPLQEDNHDSTPHT